MNVKVDIKKKIKKRWLEEKEELKKGFRKTKNDLKNFKNNDWKEIMNKKKIKEDAGRKV